MEFKFHRIEVRNLRLLVSGEIVRLKIHHEHVQLAQNKIVQSRGQ